MGHFHAGKPIHNRAQERRAYIYLIRVDRLLTEKAGKWRPYMVHFSAVTIVHNMAQERRPYMGHERTEKRHPYMD